MTQLSSEPAHHVTPEDADLLAQVRSGDPEAVAKLYARHRPGALVTARALTGSQEQADELVQDAFAAVLAAIDHGAGPVDSFPAYLHTAVRNAHYRNTRRARRLVPTDDLELFDRPTAPDDDPAEQASSAFDAHLIAGAFRTLSRRWQRVLWLSEVEGVPPAQLAVEFDISANSAAALVYRARKALAQAFLTAHVDRGVPSRCKAVAPKLAGWVREDLSARQSAAVAEHVLDCPRCESIVAYLGNVNSALRAAAPVLLTLPGVAVVATHTGAGGAAHAAGSSSGGHLGAVVGKFNSWSWPVRVASAAAVAAPIVVAVTLVAGASQSRLNAAPVRVSSAPPSVVPSVVGPPVASVGAPSPSGSSVSTTAARPAPERSATVPSVPPAKFVLSTAPPLVPLQVSVADRGSEQTFVLAPDLTGYPAPAVSIAALPAGWHAALSSSSSAVTCAETTCRLSSTTAGGLHVAVEFVADADAVAGTTRIELYGGVAGEAPVAVYPVELES